MLYLYRFDLLKVETALGSVISEQDQSILFGNAESLFYTNFERALAFPLNTCTPQNLPSYCYPDDLPERLTFNPTLISHEGIAFDGEVKSKQLKLTVSRDNPIASLFARDYPNLRVFLTIYQVVRNPLAGNYFLATYPPSSTDGERITAMQLVWSGFVSACEFEAQTATLISADLTTALERPVLTGKHTRNCQKQLYDASTCTVNPNKANEDGSYFAFREDGFAEGYDQNSYALTVPACANRPSGFFTRGFVLIEPNYLRPHMPRGSFDPSNDSTTRLALPTNGIRRSILAHEGGQLLLDTPLLTELLAGAKVSVFAGCDKARTTCQGKFGNAKRFGGFPFIPIKNIYESGLTASGAVSNPNPNAQQG